MKKTYLFFLLAVLVGVFTLGQNALAQVKNNYIFSSSSGTYSEITGTSLGTALDDDIFSATPIGFTFVFNGTAYTTLSVSANGWVAFGTGTPSSNYTPISAAGGDGTISALANDMQGNPNGVLSYTTLGSAPNRVFVVQWKDWNKYQASANVGQSYNFQIKLYETSNKIEIVYGSFTPTASYGYEVGIRGNIQSSVTSLLTPWDFQNRSVVSGSTTWASSSAGTVETATATVGVGLAPASGLTYTYQLPTLDAGIAGIPSQSYPMASGAQNVTVSLKNGGTTTLTSAVINWSINGVAQTPLNWTGSLTSGNSATVTLGSYTFNNNTVYSIAATVSNPNNGTDGNSTNNTFSKKASTPLNGTYTIGASGATFSSFNDAVTALMSIGVGGPVTLNVQSGTYTERVDIVAIQGASATNTITFQSQSGNAADVTVMAGATGTGDNFIFRIAGADYLTFRNLTFTSEGNATYGYIFNLMGGATNIRIINNVLNRNTSSTSSSTAGIFSQGSLVGTTLLNNDNLTVTGNIFNGGYYGVTHRGYSSTMRSAGTVISNNTFTNQYYYPIYGLSLEGMSVESNVMTTNSPNTSFYNMYYSSCAGQISIRKNKMSTALSGYGIYMSSCAGAAGGAIVANNFIHLGSSTNTSSKYGIYLTGSSNIKLYHNNVNIQAPAATTSGYALYVVDGSGIDVMNNNLVSTGGGYAIYWSSIGGLGVSNYNNLYTTGTNVGYSSSTNRTNLAAWQAATGLDMNSVSVDPQYFSATDLHTGASAINGRGTPIAAVTDDIDGNIRNTSSPDIGADEFSLSGIDAGLAIVSPVRPTASGANTVRVRILNNRTTTITSVALTYTTASVSVSETFTGLNIAAGSSQVVTFTTPYNVAATAAVNFTVTITQVNGGADDDASNNTAMITNLRGSLNGTYSVGTGLDFATLDAALTALDQAGVTGPVVFNIAAGTTYTSQLILKPFTGASAVNTVTIQAATGNRNDVIFRPASAPTSTLKHIIRFDPNAAYYVLNNVSILSPTSLPTSNMYGIELRSNVNNITVKNTLINLSGSTSSPGTTVRGISVEPTNTYIENITVQNSEIVGGYYAMYLYGPTGLEASNLQIRNNTIRDFYAYGVYTVNIKNSVISGNTISRPNITLVTTFYGIYMSTGVMGTTIEKNRIHSAAAASTSSAAYGIYATGADAPVAMPNTIMNNLIYNLNSTGTVYAIYNSSSDGFHVYHNTIDLSDASSTTTGQTAGIVQTSFASDIDIRNNIVSITRGGTGYKIGIWFNEVTSLVTSDNNLMYTNGSGGSNFPGGFGGFVYPTIEAYQAISGQDARSISAAPQFVGAQDYHIPYNSPAAKRPNAYVAAVSTDFDGKTRGVNFADLGAYTSPATIAATSNIDFGKVGNAVMRTIQLRNTSGNDAITISSMTFGGAGASSYKVYVAGTTTPIPSSLVLAANGSYAIDVHFGIQGYSGGGQRDAALTLVNTGAATPVVIPVTGQYASLAAFDGATNLLASGAKLDVGGVLVGGTPRTRFFTIRPDIGALSVPITLTSYQLTGPDAALFTLSTIPGTIANEVIVSITLNSQGANPGTKQATLRLNHTGANGPVSIINIEGKIGKPLLGAPSLLELPYAVIGQTYTSAYDNVALIPLTRAGLVDVDINQNPVLTGSGAGAMEIVSNAGKYFIRGKIAPSGEVVVAGNGQLSDAANWSGPSLGVALKVTDTQPWLVAVRMKQASPSSIPGSYSADILFSNGTGSGASSAENTVVTTVIGQIVSDPSLLSLYPQQLAFGGIPVGTSISKTLALRNQSGVAGTVQLSITGASYFFENGQKTMAVALPGGNDVVNIKVLFSPMSSGAANGVITASGVISGSVALSGNGQAANPGNLQVLVDGQVLNGLLNFGNVAVGATGNRTITVINNNVGPVEINSIGRSGANATQFTVGTPSTMTIPGNGGSATFTVQFVPTSLSNPQKDATITVYNSTGVPKSFNVRGTASTTSGNSVSVSLSPTQYNYGNASGSHSFVLSNTGTSPVVVNGALVLGSTNFVVQDAASSFPRTIPAGGSTTVNVRFNASEGVNGLRSASLLLVTPGVTPYPTSSLTGRVGSGVVSGLLNGVRGMESAPVIELLGSYPNPSSGESELRYVLHVENRVRIRVYSENGVEVLSINGGIQRSGEQHIGLSLRGLSSGRYYYEIEAGTSRVSGGLILQK
jgi:hypothetical protein